MAGSGYGAIPASCETETGGMGISVLSERKTHTYRIATSNSRELLNAFLEEQKLLPYIDAAVTSCDVSAGKPAPDVYLKTASLLETSPRECLVFEDVPMGILAGKNADMKVCAVEDAYSIDQTDKKRELADYYIHDYFDVLRSSYEVLT